MKHLTPFYEYIVHNFKVNDNKYWFEVRDPKDDKGYSVGWGVGDLEDDNLSKFNRTDRFEQFQIFSEVKKQFKKWFDETNPDRFYFSVPGEKRMNIYITGVMSIIGAEYEYEIQDTDYKPFDLREKNVYYVLFRKK